MATDVREGQVKSDLHQITFVGLDSCIGLVFLKTGSGSGNRVLMAAHFYDPQQTGAAQYRPTAMWQKIDTENRLNRMGHVKNVFALGSLLTWSEAAAGDRYNYPVSFLRDIAERFGRVGFYDWDSGTLDARHGTHATDVRVTLGTGDAVSISHRSSALAAAADPWVDLSLADLNNQSNRLQEFVVALAAL
jgi:hypothetical protein